jgi:hypothetical protein
MAFLGVFPSQCAMRVNVAFPYSFYIILKLQLKQYRKKLARIRILTPNPCNYHGYQHVTQCGL